METLVFNKKIGRDYEVLEKLEAGIELLGFEVKSLRGRNGTLDGAYVIVRGREAYLVNSYIPPFQPNNSPKEYDPQRNRRLLLTKKELLNLVNLEKQKGLTIVPISVYNKKRKIKVELAIVRGKKKYDKRETIKKKTAERDIERTLKNE